LNANGTLATIFNPFTTHADPNSSGLIRDPFPGNAIPRNLVDPVGSNAVKISPGANLRGNAVTDA